jgi:uncharacterized protein (DUF983 family)
VTSDTSSGTPQFGKAEYSDKPAEVTCSACGQKISSAWYRVNGAPACADCTRRLQEEAPKDSHGAFVRGLLFGVGAAIVGFVLYVVFALTTGLVIGYVSLAVGFLVGKGIALGSRGVGGRRYQIAAVALTYMAVSLAAVPIAISVHMKQKSEKQQSQASAPVSVTTPSSPNESAAEPAAPASATEPAAAGAEAPAAKMSFGKALGMLTLLGLASPFLELSDPMHGIIGLIILLVGIRIAWQLTAARPLEITGPIDKPAPAMAG